MIRIHKALEPEWFHDWKKQETPDWSPSYDNLRHSEKEGLKDSLIEEQGYLCCYCGRAIYAGNSHIEHFKPQSKYPELGLAYNNIHASCESVTSCGHKKADRFDENKCISPLEVEEGRFVFTLVGEVHPKVSDDEASKYMIELLNLNDRPLVVKRKKILNAVFSAQSIEKFSSDELQKLRRMYQERDENNGYQEFRQALTSYIDNGLTSS